LRPLKADKCNIINALLSALALDSQANPLFFQTIFFVSVGHYENFPVASLALPASLRRPVKAIYTFARTADDLADEGNENAETRLAALEDFRQSLDAAASGQPTQSPLFGELAIQIAQWQLPIQPFHDLLDAFSQDVEKGSYTNFGEVIHYCRRSANPIGRLLLHLYHETSPRSLAYSDGICTALQLINFLQDVAIDWDKGRIYLPQDEMNKAGISKATLGILIRGEAQDSSKPGLLSSGRPIVGIPVVSIHSSLESRWRDFMLAQIDRTRKILQAGAPLGLILKGRIGFELRMIIAGGDRILRKLQADPLGSLKHRRTLNAWDWTVMFTRAMFRK
jgi:squalene synthase HpnC